MRATASVGSQGLNGDCWCEPVELCAVFQLALEETLIGDSLYSVEGRCNGNALASIGVVGCCIGGDVWKHNFALPMWVLKMPSMVLRWCSAG